MSKIKNRHNWVTREGVVKANDRVSAKKTSVSACCKTDITKGITVHFSRSGIFIKKEISLDKINRSYKQAVSNK